jgi:RNA polymerase sigma-70 factor (ECF subfamily)
LQRAAGEPQSEVPGSDEQTSRKHHGDVQARALDKLSYKHRVAFVLCEIEELTSIEAAQLIGCSEGTVRTRLFHAKKRLRAELARGGIQ